MRREMEVATATDAICEFHGKQRLQQ